MFPLRNYRTRLQKNPQSNTEQKKKGQINVAKKNENFFFFFIGNIIF